MKRVEIDDPITFVFQSMTLCLTVEKVERDNFYCTIGDGLPDVGTPISHKYEGIYWIRGWHLPDSEEVKAARVAQEIGNDKKRSKRPTYRELEERAKRAETEADNARKLLDEMKRRSQEQRRAIEHETYSDAAWRRYRRGGF